MFIVKEHFGTSKKLSFKLIKTFINFCNYSRMSLKDINITALLPRELTGSLLCFSLFKSKVVDEAPDISICNTSGYMYEVKSKKILGSLNLNDNPSSLSYYYLSENKKLIIFYLVFTTNHRLLIIRRFNKRLKIVTVYDKVKEFQVYDFKCLGFPQIKLTFLNELESLIFEFPVEPCVKAEVVNNENPLVDTLTEELEELNKHIDELIEEYNHLRKICTSSDQQIMAEKICITSMNFSSFSNKVTQHKLIVCFKWLKVFGFNLALGMKLCNTGSEIIHDIEIVIYHRKIKDYVFSFFQSADDISYYLSAPSQAKRYVNPGEEIFAVGTFEVPTFYSESDLSIPCYVIDTDLNDCLLQEIFEINIGDIASQSTVELDARFTVEDLLAIKAIKSETCVKIQTGDLEDDFIESILMKNLSFKIIKHVKKKLFYCTSTYLKEVFLALEHIAVNPSVWKILLYTSDDNQIYFLVNALYELLPDNTTILSSENVD